VSEGNADDDPVSRDELETGLRFGHMVAVQTRVDHRTLAIENSALIDLLIAKGVISARELDERKQIARSQQEERDARTVLPLLGEPVDKYAVTTPDIPCSENLPLCRAACCRMVFYLTRQDLDEGAVRWEYAQPYRIRQTEGTCVHFDRSCPGCSIYAQRPAVCRSYDCRTDKRVWEDYDKRIPAAAVQALPPTG